MPQVERSWQQYFLLLLSASFALSGCGGAAKDPLYAVGGTVTVKGTPVKEGAITFIPAQGRQVSGIIENGKYSLTTYQHNDGARAGEYKVQVQAMEAAGGEETSAIDEVSSFAEELKLETDAPPRRQRIKFIVPPVYANPATTPLKATVEAKEANEINFEIP